MKSNTKGEMTEREKTLYWVIFSLVIINFSLVVIILNFINQLQY
jgi:hypothetical protein